MLKPLCLWILSKSKILKNIYDSSRRKNFAFFYFDLTGFLPRFYLDRLKNFRSALIYLHPYTTFVVVELLSNGMEDLMKKSLITLLTLVSGGFGFAQTPGAMTNRTVPMTNKTVPMGARPTALPTNNMAAPTGNSTMGPAGRPNTELAPSNVGTLNSLSNSTASGDTTLFGPYPRRSMYNNNQVVDPLLPPNTTSPLPTNTN